MTRRDAVIRFVDQQDPIYRDIALKIHAKPEISNYEFFACETLSEQLKKKGSRLLWMLQDTERDLQQYINPQSQGLCFASLRSMTP